MKTILVAGTIFLLALAGCTAPAPVAETMTDAGAAPAMEHTATPGVATGGAAGEPDIGGQGMETVTPDPNMGTGTGGEAPAWFAAPLTEVRSRQPFTLDDFAGKVVLVEAMAVWCSNCAAQQAQIAALHQLLGARDDFVSLSLDIDPNEDEDLLRGFIDKRGYDWMYAVAPEDVAREIGLLYGNQFLNPPSTPVLIIDRHGEAHVLPFGIKSAEELSQALEPFLEEGM